MKFDLNYKGDIYTVHYDDQYDQEIKRYSWFIHKTNSSTQVVTAMKGKDGKYNKQVSLARFILGIPTGDKVKIYHKDGNSMNCKTANLISIQNKKVYSYE